MNLLPQEAADRLRTSVNTLANLRCQGGGPPFLKWGRKVLYPLDKLIEWEAAHMKLHTNDKRKYENLQN